MPEGPEVKIVSDYLNKKLKQKKITSFSYCSQPYKIKYGKKVFILNLLRIIKAIIATNINAK